MWRERWRQRLAHQPFAQHVLVASTRRARSRFVVPEGLAEKARLRQQPIGAAIAGRATERLFDELVEALEPLRLAAQLIVEADHFDDQSGPQPKRQSALVGVGFTGRQARRRGVCGRLADAVPLERTEPSGRVRQPRVHAGHRALRGSPPAGPRSRPDRRPPGRRRCTPAPCSVRRN